MTDLLDMARINILPQPFLVRRYGDKDFTWPLYDIDVETGLLRLDVCGKLDVGISAMSLSSRTLTARCMRPIAFTWKKAVSDAAPTSDVVTTTWYKTSRYSTKIEPVEVIKATDKMVTCAATKYWREQQKRRNNQSEQFFPTWEEAHAFLLQRAEDGVTYARRELQYANDFLGNVKGMKAP